MTNPSPQVQELDVSNYDEVQEAIDDLEGYVAGIRDSFEAHEVEDLLEQAEQLVSDAHALSEALKKGKDKIATASGDEEE